MGICRERGVFIAWPGGAVPVFCRRQPSVLGRPPVFRRRPPLGAWGGDAGFLRVIPTRAWRCLRRSLAMSAFTKAEKILEARGISPTDRARMRALTAHTAFIRGQDHLAIQYARHLTSPDPMAASLAYWAAGLASWHKKDFSGAEHWFAALRSYTNISPWLQSAVAYWSARVALRLRRPHEVEPHLMRAAVYPEHFMVLMARQALGLSLGLIGKPMN